MHCFLMIFFSEMPVLFRISKLCCSFQGSPEVVYPRVSNCFHHNSFTFTSCLNPFFNLRIWRWYRMDIDSTIIHLFYAFITFKYWYSSEFWPFFWGSEKDAKKRQFQGQLLWTFHALADPQRKERNRKPDSLRER